MLLTILFEHGCRAVAGATKDVPQLLSKVAQPCILRDLVKDRRKEKRGRVLRRACRSDPGVPLLDDVSSLLDVGGAIKVEKIDGARISVAL